MNGDEINTKNLNLTTFILNSAVLFTHSIELKLCSSGMKCVCIAKCCRSNIHSDKYILSAFKGIMFVSSSKFFLLRVIVI